VDLGVGEGEAEEEGVGAEDGLKGFDDGDGATFAYEHGLTGEGAFEGTLGRFSEIGMGIAGVGFAIVADFDFEFHAGRAVLSEVSFEVLENLLWILVGDEAEGEFHEGLGSDHGFRTLALVAAADAVNLGGGTSEGALCRAVSWLSESFRRAGDFEEILVGYAGDFRPHFALPAFEWFDIVVKTFDCDPAIGFVQGSDDAGDRGGGVGDSTAENARVEITSRAGDFHFGAGDAAQAVAEGPGVRGDHAGVRDGDDVAFEIFAVFFEERGEVGGADFFFALEKEDEVYGEFTFVSNGFADADNMREHLAFIVGGTTGPDPPVADFGCEGWGVPEIEGIDRLDVVVAVDEDGFPIWLVLVFCDDDGVAGCLMKLGREADGSELFNDPIAAVPDVVLVLGIGGYAGKREEGEEFSEVVGHRA